MTNIIIPKDLYLPSVLSIRARAEKEVELINHINGRRWLEAGRHGYTLVNDENLRIIRLLTAVVGR